MDSTRTLNRPKMVCWS